MLTKFQIFEKFQKKILFNYFFKAKKIPFLKEDNPKTLKAECCKKKIFAPHTQNSTFLIWKTSAEDFGRSLRFLAECFGFGRRSKFRLRSPTTLVSAALCWNTIQIQTSRSKKNNFLTFRTYIHLKLNQKLAKIT